MLKTRRSELFLYFLGNASLKFRGTEESLEKDSLRLLIQFKMFVNVLDVAECCQLYLTLESSGLRILNSVVSDP